MKKTLIFIGLLSLLCRLFGANKIYFSTIAKSDFIFTEPGNGESIFLNNVIINGNNNPNGTGIFVANYFAAPPVTDIFNNWVTMDGGQKAYKSTMQAAYK